jgi:isocitrate/isopropylmalate dehydrogenase
VKGTFVKEKVQQVKPEAAFLSYSMMLELMGEAKAAGALKEAALNNIRKASYKEMKLDDLVFEAIKFVKEKK